MKLLPARWRTAPVVVAPPADPQCTALTRTGRRCRLPRLGAAPYCVLHLPATPGDGPRPA